MKTVYRVKSLGRIIRTFETLGMAQKYCQMNPIKFGYIILCDEVDGVTMLEDCYTGHSKMLNDEFEDLTS
jgi:hypothetical protein